MNASRNSLARRENENRYEAGSQGYRRPLSPNLHQGPDVENQRIKLREFAKAMEWADVAEYADQESGVESAEYRKLRRRCVTRWNAQLPLATAGRSRLAIAHATRIRTVLRKP